ncbi:acyl-CoA dehydrogenase family protein [Rhodococcus jostii]|uniref:acyl-CoA dehydrogenase family protein n=1 Tax=Rhodococcus jostii TaxID=132919 RepID=UPI00365B2B0F
MSYSLDRPSATDADRALREDLVARAAKLRGIVAGNAEQNERDRRVSQESIDAIEEAGLFSITRPRRFGGFQVDIRTKLEVSRELARGDGSTAWVTALLNGAAWLAGDYSEQAQQDVWGQDQSSRLCSVFAPSATTRRVDGGFVVTGSWGYASGSYHAQWAHLGIPIVNEAGEPVDQGLALIPMSDLSIEETWFVAGMRGTGSNTLSCEEVFVPDHRVLSLSKALGGKFETPFTDEALYRSPFVPVALLLVVGPQLGMAQAALDLAIEKAPKRRMAYTEYGSQVEAPTVQLLLAKAASLLDAAHLHAYRAAADIDEAAHHGVVMDYKSRARARMDAAAAITAAREAVRTVAAAHGASTFAEVNPLQRILRDIEAASLHAVTDPQVSALVYGRALVGIEGGVTPLV